MEFITTLYEILVHMDKHLTEIIRDYGAWTYLILFLVIFCETGLVIMPFLPGDSLLFVVGALGAAGALDYRLALIIFIVAAVGGNVSNYFIGRTIGHRMINSRKNRFIKKETIEKVHAFYERHGGKTIFLSRFLPLIRTFAPFVAGLGKMSFCRFLGYNFSGGVLWAGVFVFSGVFFGNIPFVKKNFSLVIPAIIVLTMLPGAITYLRNRYKPDAESR